MSGSVLPETFYQRDPRTVARELLGKLLCRRIGEQLLVGRIVECEAYLAEGDPACHSARGLTASNRSMFDRGGIAYVYPIHSRYCFNAVTESDGQGSAVLLRAIEPARGVETMIENRGIAELRQATNGPAKICQALAIDRALDGYDLTRGKRLWIQEAAAIANDQVRVTPRIGVTSAQDMELRFCVRNNPFVSGPRRLR